MKTTAASFCIILLGLSGCNAPVAEQRDNPVPLEILVGRWADMSQKRHFIEEWYADGDLLLKGKGFVMADKDTVFIEKLEIKTENGITTYSAKVPGKDHNSAVVFTLTENKNNRLVFENPEHDFPQKIIYDMQTRSTMHVHLEGLENGVFRSSRFIFEKQSE